MTGSTSSSTSRPLRRRRRRQRRQRERTVDVRAELATRRSVRRRRVTGSTRHTTAVTASCNAGARSVSGTAPVTAMPSGNASVSDTDSGSRSTSSANTRSRYSASLSCPVDSASPKLTFGRGEKPSVNASGSCVIRNARSSARATSRCEIQRTLPRFVYRSRTGFAAPPLMHGDLRRRRSSAGFAPRNRTGTSAPGAQVLARALAAARGRERRGHHVLEGVVGAHPAVVAGSPPAIGEAVLGQGRLPVVPEEVVVQTGGDVVPGQHLVAGAVAGHVPVGIEALGAAWRRVQRSSEKCSLHSWNVPPRPPDRAR